MNYIRLSDPSEAMSHVEWLPTGESGNGIIRFSSQMEVTGEELAATEPVALCRFYCYYAISQLNERSLREAYQTLRELYSWQVQEAGISVHEPERRKLGGVKVRQIEKSTPQFRED